MAPDDNLEECMEILHEYEFDDILNPRLRRMWTTPYLADSIAWYLEDPEHQGECLRPHHSTNYHQHRRFLEAIGNDLALHGEIIEWFLSLPLWLGLRGIRVVHGCWHERFMEHLDGRLAAGNRLDRRLMVEASSCGWSDPGEASDGDGRVHGGTSDEAVRGLRLRSVGENSERVD